jgi:hypothetical protein
MFYSSVIERVLLPTGSRTGLLEETGPFALDGGTVEDVTPEK